MHGCIERRSRRKSGKRSFRRVVTVSDRKRAQPIGSFRRVVTVSGRKRAQPKTPRDVVRVLKDTNSVSLLFAFPRVVLLEPTSLRRESEANEQRGRSDKQGQLYYSVGERRIRRVLGFS